MPLLQNILHFKTNDTVRLKEYFELHFVLVVVTCKNRGKQVKVLPTSISTRYLVKFRSSLVVTPRKSSFSKISVDKRSISI